MFSTLIFIRENSHLPHKHFQILLLDPSEITMALLRILKIISHANVTTMNLRWNSLCIYKVIQFYHGKNMD